MTFKEKVKKFWQEHKTGIIIGGITTGAIIIGCIWSENREDNSDLDYDFYEDTKLPDPPKSTCECDSVFTDDFCTKNWNDELYRENWDKINEFAKTLKLQKGETYLIEDSERYYDEPWYTGAKDGHTLVSHLIDGSGCYPPANKEEEDA
jgi:hypothetical protein